MDTDEDGVPRGRDPVERGERGRARDVRQRVPAPQPDDAALDAYFSSSIGKPLPDGETGDSPSLIGLCYRSNGGGSVPMFDAKHWRARTEEARVHAEEMDDLVARKTMLKIAEEYEKLAERAEARDRGKKSTNGGY